MTSRLVVSPAAARAFGRMAADFQRVLADRFIALVAYSPTEALAFAARLQASDLDALGTLTRTWHHEGLATPLVMTRDEFRRSLDAFPFEYQAILERRLVIAGDDPLAGVEVGREDLRRACEVQAKSHLIHLRQGWLEAGGDERALGELVVRSSTPWRLVVTRLAELHGLTDPDPAALAAWTEAEIGLRADLGTLLLGLDDDFEAHRQVVARLPEYLDAAERLWDLADRWTDR